MSDKLMFIEVQGTHKKWCFHFYGDPKHIKVWSDDGLQVNIIENTIPAWVADLGLTRPWCILQDVFNLKNPWRSR